MIQKLGLAALALALALGAGIWLGQSPLSRMAGLGTAAALAQETTAPAADAATVAVPTVPDMVLGDASAPVTVIEYASYTCPHCARFHADVYPSLKKDYIDTGKVKLVFREVYFDRYGLWAAMVARCGGPTRYFGISGLLYDQQKEWAASDDPAVVVENLKKIGRTAGMDDAALKICLEDGAMAKAMVARYTETSTADAIEGTPTFVINGQKYSNMTYEDMKKILDEKLG